MNNTAKPDVLIIGGGPSGLATAIKLADLFAEKGLKKEILLIDKGQNIGSHILSGALIKPQVFKELLPDVKLEEIPFDCPVSQDNIYFLTKSGKIKMPFHPPYMSNKGNVCASLGEICKFLAAKAVEKGVQIYSGFAVNEILYDKNGNVCGAKCIDTGLNHKGERLENFVEGTLIEAKLTIFAEGTRGSLTKKLIQKFNLQQDRNPQAYSLGVKEIFTVPENTIAAGEVYHTMGFPAADWGVFGGGFIYGLSNNKVALGLVLGLEASDPTFDTFKAFQIWKTHPFVARFIKDGKLLEAGAKTLPEGGYYSQPQYYANNALIVGDSAGFLAMPALKGIHLGIYSGIAAAKAALKAFEATDFSAKTLEIYADFVKNSPIHKEMHPVRNFRAGFGKGMLAGMFHFGTQIVTGGAGICGKLKTKTDSEETKVIEQAKKPLFKDKYANFVQQFDKVTDVFYGGVNHDEEQVPHLQINNPATYAEINIKKYGAPCQYYCPAEVYELHTDKSGYQELRIHAENCFHCKTCDIKEPADGITWKVPNGGNGPDYKMM
ncbi:MAG: electron transfer flavoprotein-ubiquinone oxidoreductase [Prevotellaceae bacterium]|jgi:electron-transferring-flavoprotein dehydrogenase|nr:electron transfer flavoprotein-ubiquinone oxidoreductase [Prevotellaceae bacterium]